MTQYARGFIALTSVLILSAIFLSMSISVASRAISESNTAFAFQEHNTARYVARACLEYARMKLERTLDYQGNEGILIHGQSCQILNIEGVGITNRTLRVESIVGAYTYRIEEIIETVSPHMVITSSKRVIHF